MPDIPKNLQIRDPAQDQFRLLVESVKEYAILMLDSAGLITTWNAGAERLKGYKAEEIIGKHFSVFYTEEARKNGHPEEELNAAREKGSYAEQGWRMRKDGSLFWADVLITAVYGESGELRGFAKVTKDLTERKKVEEALVDTNRELTIARDQAQSASKLKSEFVANMSHEIRTPMNAIIGMCNVLLKTELDDSQQQYATNIREGANTLLRVINDILDFSKIEAGKLELDLTDFDLLRVVESTCELLAPQARAKRLSLMSYVDEKVPHQLRGDPERLRQILINLVSNAIKFSADGEIVVRANLEAGTDSSTANVKFAVADQGIGISKEIQDQLFKPFVQADGSISRRFGGTGLGLSISKRLVELMHGKIGVDSSEGKGSTFWFVVPLGIVSTPQTINLRQELENLKVLIVDDEPQAGEILHHYVGSWGMKNSVAASAGEALAMLRQASADGKSFELAIIDQKLPDKYGTELGAEILKDPALADTKLILLTAFDAPGLGTEAIASGFRAFLTKPVRRSYLLESIITACGEAIPIVGSSAVVAKSKQRSAKATRSEVILIVEDYPINQQVAQLYLDELGFASHIAGNGNEALQALSDYQYALVLMDCQMPELDGFETTRAIRKNEVQTGEHIPIIAMTAHAMGGDRERCIGAGMDDYIAKPVDPKELDAVLKKWLPGAASDEPSALTSDLAPATDSQARESTPIDLDTIENRYGDIVRDMVAEFAREAPAEIAKARAALADKKDYQFRQVMHGLKGISATMFAVKMRETCNLIETAAYDETWDVIPELLDRLDGELADVVQFLRDRGLLAAE